jgi:RNA processing factor Prp31
MEKNLNTFSMRLKEGYSWHFPELAKIIVDNETFSKLVYLIGNKNNIKTLDI